MKLETISQISRSLNLSTRALRYYEQIGLIRSEKKDGYAYRVYTEETVTRIKQIIILRKLRIPLRQIAEILDTSDATVIIETFEKNLSEIDDEITALSTIREIIDSFISKLSSSTGREIKACILEDSDLLDAVDSLTVRNFPVKEEKSAENLQSASETLDKLSDHDIRIIYLPPMTAASIHSVGQNENGDHAETISADLLDVFIKQNNLYDIYPSARHFGFNNPDGLPDDDPGHGYERWITVPDDFNVKSPFIKKHISGGLYAAYTIQLGEWERWGDFHNWVASSEFYDFRWDSAEGVCGWLEEHLNYISWNKEYPGKIQQLDLLIPIKLRSKNNI